MMMNLLKYTLLIFLLSFAACSSDDDGVPSVPNEQSQPGDALELTVSAADFVTDGAPDTRATDNDKTTTFENDDRVGVIILDEDDKPIYNNIPYKYNNGKWTFDSGNDEGKGECYYDSKATTYIVYYPYSRAADGLRRVDDLKTKFAPRFNQSDIKDYRASDLMVWSSNTHLPSSEKVLNAELEHAFASIYLIPTAKYKLDDEKKTECVPTSLKISDVSLTTDNAVYVPYQTTDGSLRCIIPIDIASRDIRCFYTFNGTTYGNTINIKDAVAPNTRYTSAPEIISNTYSLDDAKVGDFYCKRSDNNEGYLIPGDVALIPKQATCIGIVMKVGRDNSGDWIDTGDYITKGGETMNTVHGYVLALYDAKLSAWSPGKYYAGANETGFQGYRNTQKIIAFNNGKGGSLKTNFPALYYATEGYDTNHPAPINSSGWFLPSTYQCSYWYNNREMLLSQVRKAMGNSSYNWAVHYWTSTEANYNMTWAFIPGTGKFFHGPKENSCISRSFLAF